MKDIIKNFKIKGKLIKISEVKNGLVNKTYLIKTNKALYLLQKINHYVFKNPDKLMHNINIVTKHLNKKRTRTLEIIKTVDNKLYYYDDVNYYRIYKYIVDLKNVEVINNKTRTNIIVKTKNIVRHIHLRFAKKTSSLPRRCFLLPIILKKRC